MALATERSGTADLTISDNGEIIAQIAGPDLTTLRFRPGGLAHIGPDVPLPLHWRQYANHQDPERNAGQNPVIERVIEEEGRGIVVASSASNASRSIESRTTLKLVRHADPVSYELSVRTALQVRKGSTWQVTPNPNHGELEFCTVFPAGTFTAGRNIPKRYQACYLEQGEVVWRIPHHHLESADKHNIPLGAHDRFLWLLEEENPCVELLSAHPVHAGLCAYMWDGHFGYSVCTGGAAVELPGDSRYQAAYRLSALEYGEAERLAAAARDRPAPGIEDIPLYCRGLNRFERTGEDASADPEGSWPWEFEATGGHAEGALDRAVGADDRRSLRIRGSGNEAARWIATTIGPAYGDTGFSDNARFNLEALVRTRSLSGGATIALRLHRSGSPGLFEPSSYELFRSGQRLSGDADWVRLAITTPSISPAPDRIHILLEHEGSGTSWFDNVLLEEHS